MYKIPKPRGSYRCILALDPGKTNMAVSIVALVGNRPKVLASKVMLYPLADMKDLQRNLQPFLKEIAVWINTFKPGAIIAERFQSRGLMGTTIEVVSAMLGALAIKYPKLPLKVITAATWKVPYQRKFDIDLKELYKWCKTEPHQLDASMIGVYGIEKGLKVDVQLDIDRFIDELESTSLTRLVARQARKLPRGKS